MVKEPFKRIREKLEKEEGLEREKSRVIDQISGVNNALGRNTTIEIMKMLYPDVRRLTDIYDKVEKDTSLERLKAITSYLRSLVVAYVNSKKRSKKLTVHEWSLQNKEAILDRYDAAKKQAKKLGIRKRGEYPKTFLDVLKLMKEEKVAEANFLLLQIEESLIRIENDLGILRQAHEDAGAMEGFTTGIIKDYLKNDFQSCLMQIDQIYEEAKGEADLNKLDELKKDLYNTIKRVGQILEQSDS
nr:hypothetical protein [Candidatus Undinarchaeales archaeon ERR594346 U_76725]